MLDKLYSLYNQLPPAYQERLKFEIDVITNNGIRNFLPYFAVLNDVANFCEEKNIPIGPARGSAAASLISYLLGITALDPIRFGLPFSRFLSKQRLTKSVPDCDLDFPRSKRILITNYVFEKYGEKAAFVAVFNSQKLKNSLQDSWRIHIVQPYKHQIQELTKTNPAKAYQLEVALKLETQNFDIVRKSLGMGPPGYSDLDWLDGYESSDDGYIAGLLETNKSFVEFIKKYPKVYSTARELLGIYRGVGTHAAGVVVANIPLCEICPVMKVDGRSVIALDKKAVSKMGFVKQDFLGLTTLDWINDCIDDIGDKELNKNKWDLPDDPEVYKQFLDNKCLSIFQHDSIGGASYVKKLRPTCKADLSASVAMNRPGALDGMIKLDDGTEKSAADTYVLRKSGELPVKYLHADLEPILKNTYGVYCYQEQVTKTIQDLLGFTEAESDSIRGAISDKNPKGFDAIKERLPRLKQRGWSDEQIADFFQQIIAFSRYSFNCIAGDQRVLTNVGEIPLAIVANNIEKFMVAYLDSSGEISFERPNEMSVKQNVEVLEIELEDGSVITGTADHKFLYNKEWIDLKSLYKTYSYVEVLNNEEKQQNENKMLVRK